METDVYDAITTPTRLWTPAELGAKPSPVPATAGVYGWYFSGLPSEIDTTACVRAFDKTLLYVGIAPGRPGSRSHLRRRLRQHCRDRGASTLRRTLAALLGSRLGLVPGSGGRGRLRIGDSGERALSEWIARNAAVTWVATPTPWLAEADLIRRLDLPLNLMHNENHPFAEKLKAARALLAEQAGGHPRQQHSERLR